MIKFLIRFLKELKMIVKEKLVDKYFKINEDNIA